MSAPIGRLQIRTRARKGPESEVGPVQTAEPPADEELSEEAAPARDEAARRYYPFAPRLVDESDD